MVPVEILWKIAYMILGHVLQDLQVLHFTYLHIVSGIPYLPSHCIWYSLFAIQPKDCIVPTWGIPYASTMKFSMNVKQQQYSYEVQAAMPVGFQGSTQSWTAAVEEGVVFKQVDVHVTNVMITWMGRVLEQTCRELLVLNKGTSNVSIGKRPHRLKFRSCQSDTPLCGQILRIWGMFGMFGFSSTCMTFLQIYAGWKRTIHHSIWGTMFK